MVTVAVRGNLNTCDEPRAAVDAGCRDLGTDQFEKQLVIVYYIKRDVRRSSR